MTGEFLLEIGTEEIPARFLPPTMEQMKASMAKKLGDERLTFDRINAMSTPRRLTLIVSGMSLKQEDQDQQVVGPPEKSAYDAQGNPTKAAEGFARAHGANVSELAVVETGKGKFVGIRRHIPGRPTSELLADLLPSWVAGLSFPKSMRWGSNPTPFARPVHWLLCLLDGRVVPFALNGIESGDLTYGHRFMAPQAIQVRDASDYVAKLEEAHVVIDPEVRRERMLRSVDEAIRESGGQLIDDPDLVTENCFLVESTNAVCGTFADSFLELPDEVLITAMREHQRYFAVTDGNGKLLPRFVAINNTLARDPAVVTQGHQRVLKARLEDAKFFFREDLKKPLADHAEALKSVLFQQKLGTSYQKMERFRELALFMADAAAPEAREAVERTATLCKADLVTEMVGEFPALQGVMGRAYARHAGESEAVAQAVYEHYLPRFAGDALPESTAGALVGMADRLDTICGCFGIGLIPTGAADPYALRRHTLAIIHILLEKRYLLDFESLAGKSLQILGDRVERDSEEVLKQVTEFFRARFHNLLTGKGLPFDVVDAVLSLHHNVPGEAMDRVQALNAWKERPEFQLLAISFKRVVNILKDQKAGTEVDESLLQDQSERELWDEYRRADRTAEQLMAEKRYADTLEIIFGLRRAIDRFFDAVMVMDKDERLKHNRLALLNRLSSLFKNIGDFSKFSV